MQVRIEVENIKCGGCANSIRHALREDGRIAGVAVDIENGVVSLEAENEAIRPDAVARLLKMGYPEKGSVEGLKSARARAVSFVSCAIGRMSDD